VTDPPLASVADYEALTGQTAGPATAYQLEVASARIRDHCGWQISRRVDDEVDCRGHRHHLVLVVPSLYVTAVNRLTWEGVDVDRADYTWEPGGLIHLHRWHALWGVPQEHRRTHYRAVIDHGYDPVPYTVVAECVARAQAEAANPTGASAVRVGDVSVNYFSAGRGAAAVMAPIMPALAPYRLPPRA
jgi:hypothetical protein